MTETVGIGQQAEDFARHHLEQHGLKLIESNFRCRLGEIDLIMRDDKTLVFVEVRYRKNREFGGPVVSISTAKQQKLRTAAKIYLQQHPLDAKKPVRFDVVGILGTDHSVEWIKNAIEDSPF
ncbi:MAG: YraN family protein [Gammaproteobacteria bacterium]|nr:YraN family protein [Gammaproteobacteria bacterium]